MTKAIVIPADATQPLRWAEHTNDDYKSMTALVFGGNRDGGLYSMSTVGNDKRVSLFYDDEGLFRLDAGEKLPDIINLRAMQLWASLDGDLAITDFRVPLVGDYVVVGDADIEGYSKDAPAWVMDFPFDWPNKYQIIDKEEE
jgi:hypothetical protein